MQGVYWWLNLVNGKVYIGSARNINKRKTAHLRALKINKHHSIHFQRAWNTYGPDAFKFEVIEAVKDQIWLEARETAWMIRLQSFKGDYGYNITRDGWTGAHYEPTERRIAAWKRNGERKRGTQDSPEVKARKKAAAQGRKPPTHLGHPHSETTRAKMRAAWIYKKARGYKAPTTFTTMGRPAWNKGKTFSEESRQKMSVLQRLMWTPERRAAQAERARKQALANPINQRSARTAESAACVVEVYDE